MGGSSWSNETYSRRVEKNVREYGTAFTYDAEVRSGKVEAKIHPLLDPKGLKFRESRDSEAHPKSRAVMVWLDVTGSMGRVVKPIHAKLPTLMGLLIRKGYITDPQILFGAVGDATCDQAPLQVGQFESGAEMEGDLSRFYIEGRGGTGVQESYELPLYVGAEKTSIDCFEKRGQKGYCFIIGDEQPYAKVRRKDLERLIEPEPGASDAASDAERVDDDRIDLDFEAAGISSKSKAKSAKGDIPIETVIAKLQEKWHVFFIIPTRANGGRRPEVFNRWTELLGQNVLQLDDEEAVAELIAMQIGITEGVIDVDGAVRDLEEEGSSTALVRSVTKAVNKSSTGGVEGIVKVTAKALPPSTKDKAKGRL